MKTVDIGIGRDMPHPSEIPGMFDRAGIKPATGWYYDVLGGVGPCGCLDGLLIIHATGDDRKSALASHNREDFDGAEEAALLLGISMEAAAGIAVGWDGEASDCVDSAIQNTNDFKNAYRYASLCRKHVDECGITIYNLHHEYED